MAGDLNLGFAVGTESFTPLGSEDIEHPVPGEIIYFDAGNDNVFCRRWNWRNGEVTKLTTATTSAVLNVDGIGEGAAPVVVKAASELAELLRKHCGGSVAVGVLNAEKQRMEVRS